MDGADRRDEERRWRPRPLLSFGLRAVSILVPAAAGAGSAYGYVAAIAMPEGIGVVPWALGLVASSTLATAVAERIGKRFLPLAVLFRLSLVFPDRAPSRFAMARGAGNVRHLERRIREARERGVDHEPVRAAEQILALVAALSAHDRKTRGHSERVRAFTDLVAGQLKLPDADRDRLRWAALLHDIGKLHVPAKILNKPGRPEPREWEALQAHPAAGAKIAAPLLPWLGAWGEAIEQHHERFGGGGYPRALSGNEISLAARIVSVADSFEVMTAARSYKKPMSVAAARRELAACAGEQFDPAIVRAFLNVSLGRLWWTVGPMSWTALAPVLGPAQRAGGQLAATAKGAAAALVVGAAGIVPVATPVVAAEASSAARASAAAADPAVGPVAEDPVRSGGTGSGVPGSGSGVPGSGSAAHGSGSGAHGGVAGEDDASTGSSNGGGLGADGTDGDGGGDGEPSALEPPDDPAGGGGPSGTLDDVVQGTTGAVDDIVDGAAGTVSGVVDGATDVVDGLTGGTAVSDLLDEPVDDLSGLLGGLLGS